MELKTAFKNYPECLIPCIAEVGDADDVGMVLARECVAILLEVSGLTLEQLWTEEELEEVEQELVRHETREEISVDAEQALRKVEQFTHLPQRVPSGENGRVDNL